MRALLPSLALLAGCRVVGIEVATPATTSTTAPDFALTSQDGATVTLAGVLAEGPALLVFYRGFW